MRPGQARARDCACPLPSPLPWERAAARVNHFLWKVREGRARGGRGAGRGGGGGGGVELPHAGGPERAGALGSAATL